MLAHSNAAIDAAIAGRGFPLVRRALVHEELAARQLVALQCRSLAAQLAYYLVIRPETLIDPSLHCFREWIIGQKWDTTN